MTNNNLTHLDTRVVYQSIVALSHTASPNSAAMLRGLAGAAGDQTLVSVAELEAGLALLLLRHRSGLSFTLEQGITELFGDVGESDLTPEAHEALIRRVVATAGGLWSDPDDVLADTDRDVLIRAYLAATLDILGAIGELDDDPLGAYRAYSDYQVHAGAS